MPECIYCGRKFRTRRGLQQHIRRAHGINDPFERFGKSLARETGRLLSGGGRRKRRKRRGLFDLGL